MSRVSFARLPVPALVGVLGAAAYTVALFGSPSLRQVTRVVLQLVWLYFATGARG